MFSWFHARALCISVGVELICTWLVLDGVIGGNQVRWHWSCVQTDDMTVAQISFPELDFSCWGSLGSKTPLFTVPLDQLLNPCTRKPKTHRESYWKRAIDLIAGELVKSLNTQHRGKVAQRGFCCPTFPWDSQASFLFSAPHPTPTYPGRKVLDCSICSDGERWFPSQGNLPITRECDLVQKGESPLLEFQAP